MVKRGAGVRVVLETAMAKVVASKMGRLFDSTPEM